MVQLVETETQWQVFVLLQIPGLKSVFYGTKRHHLMPVHNNYSELLFE